ncbi:MAG TPA: hypothetical protein VGH59_10870 [Casimicrobiaceae bacterium]|jgi:hypothetical protein
MIAAQTTLRIFVASIVFATSAACEAIAEEVPMGLFTVTLPVIAILNDNLYIGDAVAHVNRTGTITLRSVLDPKDRCVGSFRFTSLKTGLADMRCDDGVEAQLSFNALSVFSGYGYGSTPKGPASFTFGLGAEEAAAHLTVPQGRKLVQRSDGLRLESIRP